MSTVPGAPGAYALIMGLTAPLALVRPRPATLPPGVYVYLGSARGPGGIAARTRRHVRRDKRPRWHVDALTLAAAVVDVIPWPDGDECLWTTAVRDLPGVTIPVPGFGSSDCRQCPSHLLALPFSPTEIARAGAWVAACRPGPDRF